MSIIGKLREKWKLKRERKGVGRLAESPAPGPIIETQWGNVTESARLRAAMNMAEDHDLRRRVIALLARQKFDGDLVRGEEEARRRYPEAFVE